MMFFCDEHKKNVLQIIKLTKRFGGLVAVDELELEVREGQICALIGPNGSGKTTVLNLITGVYRNDGGIVEFLGNPIQFLSPHEICWQGIARTFQNIRILKQQTVFENALLGKGYGNGETNVFRTVLNTTKEKRDAAMNSGKVMDILDFVGLSGLREEKACNLPYGKQKMLEIARAMVTNPRLLLLDEPAAGLNTQEIRSLIPLISKINGEGVSILLIEHRMEFVSQLADWVFVLDYGKKIAEGTFKAVRENPDVVQAYLGRGGRKACL